MEVKLCGAIGNAAKQQCIFGRRRPIALASAGDPVAKRKRQGDIQPPQFAAVVRCASRAPPRLPRMDDLIGGAMGTIIDGYRQRLAEHEIEPDAAQAALAARLDSL